MQKYRKKPVEIKAVQWFPDKDYMNRPFFRKYNVFQIDANTGHIDTLEGMMVVNSGDWIIKGSKGEFYPCKPDIFEATYEKI